MRFAPVPDKRRSSRQWVTIPVHILAGKSRIEGTTLNLSDHGMYLFTAANLPLEGEIQISFCPPGEKQSVQVCAVIRRKVVYLYGIEFVDEKTKQAEDSCVLSSQPETGEELSSDSVRLRESYSD